MARILIRNVNVACESAFEVARRTYDITGACQRQYIHSALGGFGALPDVKLQYLHDSIVSLIAACDYVRWKPLRMSRVARRKITGRPCGQVVGEEVFSNRSINQRIFSGVSDIFTLIAA